MGTDTDVDLELRPLQLLASAIAGRSVEVAAATAGARTWTDGRTIYLEHGVDPHDRLRLLGVQASLLAGGSFSPEVVVALRGHRAMADRYLAVEGHRALAANARALPPWMRTMVDRSTADRVRTPADSLVLARQDRSLAPAWAFGTIDARRIMVDAERAVPSAALDARARIESADPAELEVLDAVDDEAAPAGTDLGHLLSSPVGGGGAVGRLLAKLLRPTRSRDGGGGPGADTPTHLSGRRVPGRTSLALVTRGTSLEGAEPAEAAVLVYPEWDDRQQAYRPGWCRVQEDLAEVEPGPPVDLVDRAALRRALARLGTELAPCRRQRQGDDLDLDALVEARVDRAAGGPQGEDVYLDHLRRTRALSVLVLLDVSGSAAEPGVAGRSIHEHQREAAAALTTALHRLGDRVALHAFRSRGRSAVQVTRVKGFDDVLDDRVARRLGGLRPAGFTRLGAAIRHGSALLDAGAGTPRRLLLVLSDGFAYDHGYEGGYGEADARRALLEARRKGIGCLCLSVGADADLAALQRVFGASAHAALPTAESLAASIGPLFAAALRSAETCRRGFQRTERTRERLLVERRR